MPSINRPDAFWMPFTPNAKFKSSPRLLESARGMFYQRPEGGQVLDGTAGLWCCNLGHGRSEMSAAITQQLDQLDFCHSFNLGHEPAFDLAGRLADILPGALNHVFFTNSGSESVDTAMKMALAIHQARGNPTRRRFISRAAAYHGVNFGGTSLGGIPNNRKRFGNLFPAVDHVASTHRLPINAFSKGLPSIGEDWANEIEDVLVKNGPENYAAVFVEPVSGAGGVYLPPEGYLKRIREICDQYSVLLVFDEVITAFGRLGAASAAERFGVTPDMMTMAKGLTSGVIPMGGVGVSQQCYEALVNDVMPAPELFHGYTYSAHPVACAAALTALDIYQNESLFSRALSLEAHWINSLHSLADHDCVVDIRALGLIAGIEFQALAEGETPLAARIYEQCFENGLLVRVSGNSIALSPPLIISDEQITELVSIISDAISAI